MNLEGSLVAIITPFKDGKVDEECLRKLVNWHIEQGTNGLVPCGTTGESATLSHDEHEQVVEIVVDEAKGKIPVVAGTGSNNTEEAVRLSQHAEKAGADACLVIAPYYNKPTQRGIYEHFKKVADSVKIPIVMYNIQSRTGINMQPETIAKLANDCKNIIAIKEASGSLDQACQIRLLCGDKLTILSGDDALLLPLMSVGAKGVISVVANIVPNDVANIVKAFNASNITEAMKWHYKLYPLIKAMFIETNPIPVKAAMKMLGLCSDDLRLPMYEMEEVNKKKLEKALKEYGIL
ncbi:4-hydroxy-tetrahydrodipicolinate synthase [bacterium]